MTHLLEVANLSKRVDAFVLDRISFWVEPGQAFGVLGSHGAGKSLLMAALSGQRSIDGGTVTVGGNDLHRQERQARTLFGNVPQQPDVNVPDHPYTPRELLTFEADLRGLPLKYRMGRIEEVLTQTGLVQQDALNAAFFSVGMRKRLSIARALLHSPRLLYLDSPTDDAQMGEHERQLVWRILVGLQEQGVTMVIASCNRQEVSRLCEHFVVLEEGTIREKFPVES